MPPKNTKATPLKAVKSNAAPKQSAQDKLNQAAHEMALHNQAEHKDVVDRINAVLQEKKYMLTPVMILQPGKMPTAEVRIVKADQ